MTMLKKFGEIILDYFLINYPNTNSFKLSVDDYTFSEFALMCGIAEEDIVERIQAQDTLFSDDFEALAIAAYQVKIVGDVETIVSSGSDSYYQKIRDNYSSYKNADNNSICNKYFSNQINLWKKVQEIFEKKGGKLEIPDDHAGAGRYVQYPVKSHEIRNSDLLRWADEFLRRGLKPQDINITYQYFCSLFSIGLRKESYKRTIYNFYKIWDGRSFSDILNQRHNTIFKRDLDSVDTTVVLDYLTYKIEFINQETGETVKFLSDVQTLFYTQSNKIFWVQNEEDDFFSSKKNKIDFGLDFIILSKTELKIQDSYLENRFKQDFGKEPLFVYVIKFSKDICTELGIDTAQKPPLALVGGLKKSKNCYYSFGLPVIEFLQHPEVMYINTTMVQVDSDRVVLSKLSCLESIRKKGGSVTIRLSDYVPINFKVESIGFRRDVTNVLGWEYVESRYVPVVLKTENIEQKGTIVGFNSTIKFDSINNNVNEIDNRREFIIQNDYLEKRFSKIRSPDNG